MNLFRVDFIQGKTNAQNYNQVVHSLADSADERVIQTLSISPQKLQSVSNYTREPRRLSFQCYIDAWLRDYLMNPDYEHERYISHFEVRAYRNDVRFFAGIIETSYLKYDHATEVLTVTCYDKIRLFSIYNDLEHLYFNVLGYFPHYILGYAIQDIRNRIPINISYSEQLSPGHIVVSPGEALKLTHIDLTDMYRVPANTPHISYSLLHPESLPINGIKAGFINDAMSDRSTYAFSCRTIIIAQSGGYEQYRAKYLARVVELYNGICTAINEYEHTTDWLDMFIKVTEHDADMYDWFHQNGIRSLSSLNPNGQTSAMSYLSVIHPDIYQSFPPANNGNLWAQMRAYGNIIPVRILPGKAYESGDGSIKTPSTKVIQAMLMMHNATLLTDNNGRIRMQQKDVAVGAPIEIDELDILALSDSRGNQETPDTSILDVFAGDTTLLQSLVKTKLLAFYMGVISCTVTIYDIDKYSSIEINKNIKIKGKTYCVTEIDTDFINDELRIKAWQV